MAAVKIGQLRELELSKSWPARAREPPPTRRTTRSAPKSSSVRTTRPGGALHAWFCAASYRGASEVLHGMIAAVSRLERPHKRAWRS